MWEGNIGMNPEESEAISSTHSQYVTSYKNWFQNRNEILNKKNIKNLDNGKVDLYVECVELEVEMESLFSEMLHARLKFYKTLQQYGFTEIKFSQRMSYTITRWVGGNPTNKGIKDCYKITDE